MQGVYFDGLSSRARDAQARFDASGLVLRVDGIDTGFGLRAVRIEPQLGGLRRVLHLQGGARFETTDLTEVRALEAHLRANRGLRVVQALEGRWRSALLSVLALALAVWGFTRFGLPALAGVAAQVTPPAVLRVMDAQTLRLMDRQYLKPSRLPNSARLRLSAEFTQLARERGSRTYPYRLAFRRGGKLIGANAFALPDGTVVLTDELVRLSKSDREVMGVLAHEVGHVERRHAAKSVYQGAGLLLFASLVTGDVTSAGTVGGTVALLVAQNGYSRDMEAQADGDAARYLMRHNGTTAPLRNILTRLTRRAGDDAGLLSTHPGLQARLDHLLAIQQGRAR